MMGSIVWAQEALFIHIYLLMLMLGYVCSWVELPVQRKLCPIFVREVGLFDLHECFRGLTGSQLTPEIWGVTEIVPNVENSKFGDIDVILGILKLDKTKYLIVLSSSKGHKRNRSGSSWGETKTDLL